MDDLVPSSRAASRVPLGGGESVGFDQLLLTLYRSLHAAEPWVDFLKLLCSQINSCAATLVLRQPARGDRGEMFDVFTRKPIVEIYRTTAFPDDPFLDLEEGVACSIFDRVTPEDFQRSRFYNELLRLDNDVDILALNVAFGDYVGSFKISRRQPRPLFGMLEKTLMMRLYPHLKVALEIYERSRRQLLENRATIKAIGQLSFGVIIINERGHVVRINEPAAHMMEQTRLLRMAGRVLEARPVAANQRLAALVQEMLHVGSPSAAAASLKLTSEKADQSLYLLLKPIHDGEAEPKGPALGIAIFLSADKLQRNVSIGALATLYGISRAEVALVAELLDGASIIEAATELGISEHTARAQLRSIFVKTGTHRQTDLIRLVLTSLAIIA